MLGWLVRFVCEGQECVIHTVKQGETLSGIAQTHYGDARMWRLIAAANAITDPDRLREGAKLVMPASNEMRSGSSASLTPQVHPGAGGAGRRTATATAVPLDSEAVRRLAAAAVLECCTNLDLSAYDPGYIIRLESPGHETRTRVIVTWLGREALAVAKGATLEEDRKQVLKIEVWMSDDGQVLKVGHRPVWLNRVQHRIPGL